MNLNESEELIIQSFKTFITNSSVDSSCLDMLSDAIVSSYVVNTIKQFYEEYENHKIWIDNNIEEAFDLESFIEIIDAYFDGFKDLNLNDIIVWLIELKHQLDALNKSENDIIEKNASEIENNEAQVEETKNIVKNKKKQSKNKLPLANPDIENLCEMFPSFSFKKVTRIYKNNSHDYNHTLDELLTTDTLSNDDSIDEGEETKKCITKYDLTEDEKRIIKEKTVEKYGYVKVIDKDETISPMNHPIPLWKSEKKLVRYFDSKVVTVKGDKTFIPKTDEEIEHEKEMKKTYINLKPARAYRFH